jgi:hypothetical protein
MILKEEALSWLEPVDELGTAPDFDVVKAINLIYDSIGSCEKCKWCNIKNIKSRASGYSHEYKDYRCSLLDLDSDCSKKDKTDFCQSFKKISKI